MAECGDLRTARASTRAGARGTQGRAGTGPRASAASVGASTSDAGARSVGRPQYREAGNPDLQVQWCPPQVKGGKTRAHITRAD